MRGNPPARRTAQSRVSSHIVVDQDLQLRCIAEQADIFVVAYEAPPDLRIRAEGRYLSKGIPSSDVGFPSRRAPVGDKPV